ncbi:tRNA delta(2)-isopentenylpyrophosphate transferase [Bordetella sp. H567]|uniref:tRNA (adenosine(37)-N6)-dimethylallyltransferase MiaA n=1 Tax=Bordetella sp. H567 TaxID=1697043 RepID=UPI00081C6AFE|nr:tRNA (adenosine(37)-N6)-dimethylallyltransferase MiaA [Bordetella sp. H567]AOB30323.1 tRNA delta(2)-isopentenylpyrophosphate transferase [Bordetella sp. H567]
MTARPILCLTGPTAAGKSAATLALAQRWPLEIVNVDSATIYRGMDIGTAKPGAEERARVPQHLLDIRDPAQAYSAAEFRADALRLIDEIHGRGHVPLLAGGTMLYFKALREGLDDLPSADPALRASLEARAADIGWPAMHAELARLDPATASRLKPNDSQRIQRALEVCIVSGQPMSALLRRSTEPRQQTTEDAHRYVTISLEPTDRAALHARIAQRFDLMLEQGLVDEVRTLRARGDLHAGMPSMRCVGYRQLWTFLDGETDLSTAREQGIAATRQLAKRQLTWLRAQPDRIVVDCLSADAVDRVADAGAEILKAWNGLPG